MDKYVKLLGRKVIDKVTNFTGVITSVSFDLYGCIQVIVQPSANEKGVIPDSRWFDVARLTVEESPRVIKLPDFNFEVSIPKGEKGSTEKPLN